MLEKYKVWVVGVIAETLPEKEVDVLLNGLRSKSWIGT